MNYKFKTKPYKHQMTALEKSWNKENFAYFMEMGTGKTKVLIDNMSMLYDKGKIDGALIVAPKGVVKTWYEQELPAHLPDHIDNVSILWQSNITKKQQEKLNSVFSCCFFGEGGKDTKRILRPARRDCVREGIHAPGRPKSPNKKAKENIPDI